MAAATNDLNKIIKDMAIQMPQCMKMVDEIVKAISGLGQYDVKKLKANVKNFKKITSVVHDYFDAVNEIVAELGKKSAKGKGIAAIADTLIQNDPTAVTGQEKTIYETGYALFDQTANALFTIQKIINGLMDFVDGKKGGFMKRSLKLKLAKKVLLKAVDVVFEIIQAVCEKIEKIQMKAIKDFDFETFEQFVTFFDKLHKLLKRILTLIPLMILVIIASPLVLIGFSVIVLILNAFFLLLKLVNPKSTAQAQAGVTSLVTIFGLIGILFIELIILALAMPYAIDAAVTVLVGMIKLSLCLIATCVILWLLGFIVSKMRLVQGVGQIVLVILALDILVLELLVIALMLWGLQVVAKKIDWGEIFKFLIMVIIMIVIFTVLGYVAMKCSIILYPALSAIMYVVGAITFIVGLLLLMAVMLWCLQYIYLDVDKIKENVKTIISTALFVIECIFSQDEGEDAEDSKGKPWYKKLLSMLGNGIMMYIEAIIAVRFIAMMFIAISFILLIAWELRLLQILDLDTEKIKENVRIVLDTAMMVVYMVLYNSEEEPEEQKGKSWFKKLFELVGTGILQIIEVILTVHFLLMIFAAISFVLLIAAELRLLQMIDLDENLIKQNVRIVLDTAQMVVDSIFNPDDGENKESSKGFFETLIGFLDTGLAQILKAIMAVAYLALITVSILLIMFIAKMLEYIQQLELDSEKIKENVRIVIDTANMVVSSVFDPADDKEEDPSSKGFFRTLLEWLGMESILQILDAIMAIAYLALILVAIYLIKYIAETLKFIQDLDLDAGRIEENVTTVMRCSRLVMDSIYKKDNTKTHSQGGIFKKLLKMILPSSLMEFLDAILAIGTLTVIKTAVGLVGEIAMNLTTIAQLPSMDGIEGKVGIVMSTARRIISAVFDSGGGSIGDMKSMIKRAERAENYLNRLIKIPRLLNKVVNGFNELKDLQEDAEENALKTIDSLCKIVNQFGKMDIDSMFKARQSNKVFDAILNIMRRLSWMKLDDAKAKTVNYILHTFVKFGNSITRMNIQDDTIRGMHNAFREVIRFTRFVLRNRFFFKTAMPMIERILHVYGKFFRSIGYMNINTDKVGSMQSVFKTITDFNASMTDENISKSATMLQNYDTFLTRIDTLKIENLQTAAKIFEEMARFSESISGNFDTLAETLNERIAPLMEELKNTLDQVNNKVVDKEKNGQSSYEQVKESMLNSGQLVGLSTAGAEQAVKQRMAEENREITGIGDISDKLSELIRLFNEGTAKVKHV